VKYSKIGILRYLKSTLVYFLSSKNKKYNSLFYLKYNMKNKN